MKRSGFHFRLKGEEDGQATFEELQSFNRLRKLSISVNWIPWDKYEDLSWINRLIHFELPIYQTNSILSTHGKRGYIQSVNLSQEWIRWF